ncbi:UNVERIFIED_CONTAM: hypothetical protein Sradi_5291800 [Sesamum radiatum]|uniref:Uncharacterized protein n=1 Tax=Sesamum radiatum TaxID=300843 RepID=A0AAW2LPL5_SESRA
MAIDLKSLTISERIGDIPITILIGDRFFLGIHHPLLRLHWIRLMRAMPHDTATSHHIQDTVFGGYIVKNARLQMGFTVIGQD